MNNQTPDRVTYAETRSIAFGDYETRTVFISVGSDKKNQNIREIRESASGSVGEGESVEKVVNRLSEKVGHLLDKKEVQIRKLVLDNGYQLSGDEDTYEKKLINAQDRVKAYKVKKEMKKTKKA